MCLKNYSRNQIEQNTRISLHQGQFKWDAYKEENELRSAFSQAEKIRLQIIEGENQFESLNKQLDENNRHKENNLRLIDEAKHQLTASNTESTTLQQQIELTQYCRIPRPV